MLAEKQDSGTDGEGSWESVGINLLTGMADLESRGRGGENVECMLHHLPTGELGGCHA
jgi:hypothetical protein